MCDNLLVLVYVRVDGGTMCSHYGTHCVLSRIGISVHKLTLTVVEVRHSAE